MIHVENDELARANKLISIIRSVLGITSKDLAYMLGITRVHVLRIECGKSKVLPTLYLACCFIFEKIAKDTSNAAALTMLDLLVDIDKKVKLPSDMKDRCIDRCWRAKQNSARQYGTKYPQENVAKELGSWLKDEYYHWLYEEIRNGR